MESQGRLTSNAGFEWNVSQNFGMFLAAMTGLGLYQVYKYYQLGKDNMLCSEMAERNEAGAEVVFKNDHERLPWVDHIDNTDPENNNGKRDKRWNMRKVAIAGRFVNQPVLGRD